MLGSFTTTQLVALLDLFLFAAGIEAEFHEGDYGVFRQEVLDPGSGLYAFKPQVLFLATTRRDLGCGANLALDGNGEAAAIESELRAWAGLWDAVQRNAGCQIIQNNFVAPASRAAANHELALPGSLGRIVAAMNRAFAAAAPTFVTIHDADHLAASWGRWRWDDPRFFHHAKLPCDPEFLVDYAHSVASLVMAQLGLAKKCLVLDLDNTLWGGVIGDDGLDGIRLGQGTPEGEAFVDFQHYAKSLRQRGILLAVCSKNNEATALEVFEKHTEMVLRRADISCFVANWEDKATNLRLIAKTLNIGVDSLVFADDNPAERLIVRRLAPEVAVPELSDDVTSYVRTLEQHRYFQVLSLGAEDLKRTEFYRADAQRRDEQASAGDLDSFLRSLDMTAHVGPITPMSLERSAQLIQRSNQFNLTTRRKSAAELSALLADDAWISRTVSLADRFGDNGLISVLLAHVDGDALEIDTWLMSCRVLRRGVEQFLLNHLVGEAQKRGLRWLRGVYVPTQKNQLVRDHYAGLGFASAGPAGAAGETTWELTLGESWTPRPNFIKETNHGPSAQ
ncbi:MAG: HAD family hydrolase [Opitutaceae bacterium]|nr:HAD family hydrolase [Opitutaceae bacterium]